MKKLHLVTQDDQPYGSTRRCCEKCGLASTEIHNQMDRWTDNRDYYNDHTAASYGLELCNK